KKLVASKNADKLTYHFQNSLGSNTYTTNELGQLQSKAKQYPYGKALTEESFTNDEQKYLYTGKEKDTGNLYYFGARYYNSRISRFTSTDPLTQSPAHYDYAAQNPFKFIDPDGKEVYIIFSYEWKDQAQDIRQPAEQYYNQHATMVEVGDDFKTGFEDFLINQNFEANNDVVIIFAHSDQYRLWSTGHSLSGITTSPEVKRKRDAINRPYALVSSLSNLNKMETLCLMSCKPAGDQSDIANGPNPVGLTDFSYPNLVRGFLDQGVGAVEGLEDTLYAYDDLGTSSDSTGRFLVPYSYQDFNRYTLNNGELQVNEQSDIENIYNQELARRTAQAQEIP
ncbi:MAG: RHS repeat-associated core domain-containing protein, partial [Nanoarchaeota archaeon]